MITELREANEQLVDILDAKSSVAILLIDDKQLIADCNNGFLKMFSLSEKPRGVDLTNFLISGDQGVLSATGVQEFACNPNTGVHGFLVAHRLPGKSGLLLWCERLVSTNNQVVEQMALLNSEFIAIQRELDKKNHHLKQVQHELEEKVVLLEKALSKVKQLEGTIPICMYCKQIRDEKKLWHQLERYISDHSEAMFSHSICPACFEKNFGEN